MTGYKLYRGLQVESAGPLGLVILVYDALVQSLLLAKSAAENDDIETRTLQTSRAMRAILELFSCIDYVNGGQIASNLASLYAYMNRRILEGQDIDTVAALDEVLLLAQTLREGWQGLAKKQEYETESAPSLAVAA